jgi:hypothetical protein
MAVEWYKGSGSVVNAPVRLAVLRLPLELEGCGRLY